MNVNLTKMKTVLVFKTSITKNNEIKIVQPTLNRLITKNDRWNFDLEDCDNILRVETQMIKADAILKAIQHHGFYCEELL
ncbi:hypothetical protein KUL156_28050 [Alteromonas sp. KUL156]|nr:hypothetical protein [Tenacibaculum sp. XPcli2-G]BFF36248.1 hypothetical protein BACT7_11100 [Tenacibaculum mesophilum]GFD91548.1 hypothetical protein KUL154_02810 [Alteromonas sp. KUL154]GFE00213.1 hypothetical protein KUL156_28050 [Alteromonas sp. KUL156]